MKCAHARKEMSAYLDGELGDTDRRRMAMHLEACELCRTEYAGLQRVHSLLAQAERHVARPVLAWRVAAATRSREAIRAPFFPVAMRLAAQAAALSAVMVIGVASGDFLAGGSAHARAVNPARMLSLDLFAAAPPDSPGGVYLALTEAGHE